MDEVHGPPVLPAWIDDGRRRWRRDRAVEAFKKVTLLATGRGDAALRRRS